MLPVVVIAAGLPNLPKLAAPLETCPDADLAVHSFEIRGSRGLSPKPATHVTGRMAARVAVLCQKGHGGNNKDPAS